MFVALMLAGRLLEQRALERNRGFLRSEESFGSLWVRRLSGGIATLIPSREVEPGDQLLIAPGEWVPVQSRLLSPQAWMSREWMTGESQVEVVPSQSDLEAGSLNAGTETFQAEALEPFESSRLVSLLEVPSGRIEPDSGPPRFWHLVGRFWVAAVFLCAGFGALLWWKEGLDSTLRVVAAGSCAVGIAIPLARKLATSRLRRQGCWIRNEGVLERVGAIRKVVFDKTGTLTISGLRQGFLEKLAVLPEEAIQAAYNLALGSRHPRIRGLADLLVPLGGRYHEGITVTELPGLGCETRLRDKTWRLGKAAWATDGAVSHGTWLSADGKPLLELEHEETLRPGVEQLIRNLSERGFECWILSGDASDRVERVARRLGIPCKQALGDQTPEEKARIVDRLDRGDTLYLGDGINDLPAFRRVLLAGSPPSEAPVVPGRSDFFLLGPGLHGLEELISEAHSLGRLERQLLASSVLYNVGTVAGALLSGISPLTAAFLMPASSLLLIARVLWWHRGRLASFKTDSVERWRTSEVLA